MRTARFIMAIVGVSLLLLAGLACEREDRRFRDTRNTTTHPDSVALTPFHAGGPPSTLPIESPFRDNAYGISEGKRLYGAFNCSGCHAMNGGGGMGPALSDDQWIYGFGPEQIYSTIVQGRPDGMPSFKAKLSEQQIWQLVAYIESLSAATPRDAAPGRPDDLSAALPETRTERLTGRQTGHR